jgi:DNA modification methylase
LVYVVGVLVTLPLNQIVCADALDFARSLPADCVDLVVTSPPYYSLRDYGVDGQMGLEATPEEFVTQMVALFREIRRTVKPSGVLICNMGDTYWSNPGGGSGSCSTGNAEALRTLGRQNRTGRGHPFLKPKDLVGMPWMLALALRNDGWYLRGDYIWHKPNPVPESVTDRCTKAHEYLFHLTKSEYYHWDQVDIREAPDAPAYTDDTRLRGGIRSNDLETLGLTRGKGNPSVTHPLGRNKRSVWEVPIQPTPDAHFATYPFDLIRPAIKAGCPAGGLVYDPFMGSGTTAIVALQEDRNFIGSELNPTYVEIAQRRIGRETGWAKRPQLSLEAAG